MKVKLAVVGKDKFVEKVKTDFDCIMDIKIYSWNCIEEFLFYKKIQDLKNIFINVHSYSQMLKNLPLLDLISSKYNSAKVILFIDSAFSDKFTIDLLKMECVVGCVLLKEFGSNYYEILKQVEVGGAILSPTIANILIHKIKNNNHIVRLSNREKQVLEEIANCKTPREIAQTFNTSVGTVRNQLKSIYKKLGVKNRMELMRKASEIGLLG